MRNKLVLPFVVMLASLCFSSCETPPDSEANSSPETRTSEQTKHYVVPDQVQSKLTETERTVRDTISTLQPSNRQITKDSLMSKVGLALVPIQALDGSLESAIVSSPTDEVRSDLTEAKAAEGNATIQLNNAKRKLELKQKQDVSDDERDEVLGYLIQSQKDLGNVKSALAKANTRSFVVKTTSPPRTNIFTTNWMVLAGTILGAIILIGLILFVAKLFFGRIWSAVDSRLAMAVNATIDGFKRQQTDLATKISKIESSSAEVNSRLTDIQFEVKSIGRLIRDLPPDRPQRTPDSSYGQVAVAAAPAFPASVSDYIESKQRTGTVVRPDFQKGILVIDPESESELMLVREAEADGETIMVPRIGQFQTRQDFHTYFGKYYDCQNPTSGDVWILRPAVVSTVPGGWELQEKGLLEVR